MLAARQLCNTLGDMVKQQLPHLGNSTNQLGVPEPKFFPPLNKDPTLYMNQGEWSESLQPWVGMAQGYVSAGSVHVYLMYAPSSSIFAYRLPIGYVTTYSYISSGVMIWETGTEAHSDVAYWIYRHEDHVLYCNAM
jgi:hypothetical protein